MSMTTAVGVEFTALRTYLNGDSLQEWSFGCEYLNRMWSTVVDRSLKLSTCNVSEGLCHAV